MIWIFQQIGIEHSSAKSICNSNNFIRINVAVNGFGDSTCFNGFLIVCILFFLSVSIKKTIFSQLNGYSIDWESFFFYIVIVPTDKFICSSSNEKCEGVLFTHLNFKVFNKNKKDIFFYFYLMFENQLNSNKKPIVVARHIRFR